MPRREKRIEKSLESLKKQIESHFEKLESDVRKGDEILSRYHIKEIEKSFLVNLEGRMKIIGETDEKLLKSYRKRLNKIKERFD